MSYDGEIPTNLYPTTYLDYSINIETFLFWEPNLCFPGL